MSELTPKEVAFRWFNEVWNRRNPALAHELMAADAVAYLEGGLEVKGPAEFIAFQAPFLEAIPDIYIELVDILADDDDACVHWTANGTHTGPGLGMAPSGQAVSFRGVTWIQVKGGKITSGRDFWNMEGLMGTLSRASAKLA